MQPARQVMKMEHSCHPRSSRSVIPDVPALSFPTFLIGNPVRGINDKKANPGCPLTAGGNDRKETAGGHDKKESPRLALVLSGGNEARIDVFSRLSFPTFSIGNPVRGIGDKEANPGCPLTTGGHDRKETASRNDRQKSRVLLWPCRAVTEHALTCSAACHSRRFQSGIQSEALMTKSKTLDSR